MSESVKFAEIGVNQIIQGDCYDLLPQLPEKAFDAIITDPPYCTTDLSFDKRGLNVQEFLQQSLRVLKPNGYFAMFAPVEIQAEAAKVFIMRFSGAWIKPSGGMRTHTAKKPMNQWELYCVFVHPQHKISELTWNKVAYPGKPYKKIERNTGYRRGGKDQLDRACNKGWTQDGYVTQHDTRNQTDVIVAPSKPYMRHNERTPHPTQKPFEAISVLIQWLTNPGDLVLDPFSGSGTTALACKRLNRQFVAIEKENQYWRLSVDRLNNDVFQPELNMN